MAKPRKAPASSGTMFHKASIAALIVGAAGMFAIGALTKKNTAESVAVAVPKAVAQAIKDATDKPFPRIRAAKSGIGEAALDDDGLAKPLDVELTHTTGKLWDLFRDIGYEIDGVRVHGEVPRLFLASLPADLRHQPRAEMRKTTFIKSTLPLILHVNELILQDRERLAALGDQVADGRVLSEQDRLWLDETAERYGSKSADPADLLTHVDIVPPSLAIAQAAEESGWGTSRFAREGNALFGQRAYKAHRKGIVPVERPEGTSFRVRAFDHLIDGVKSYMHNLNSHPAYRDFREARAKMRAEEGNIDGYDLAGALLRYSERGVAYVKTIRVIMRSNTLRAFDGARLGRSISPDA
jgi:Bax protein